MKDPTAEFLAQEKEAFSELGDETILFDSIEDTLDSKEDIDLKSLSSSEPGFTTSSPKTFEKDYEKGSNSPFLTEEFESLSVGDVQTSQPSIDDVISHASPQERESEAVKLWRDNFEARLAKKDAEEEEARKELFRKAQQDLSNYKENYQRSLACKSRKTCESAEKRGAKELTNPRSTQPTPQDWREVCEICNFTAKGDPGASQKQKLRTLLLTLKE
ncbi:clathrin light chain-like [Zophobas morio]|uniref:clathrin light chain-like n=1 Tax=Zophobas morio TaxID=2755281 RepID=UPI003082F87E